MIIIKYCQGNKGKYVQSIKGHCDLNEGRYKEYQQRNGTRKWTIK